ncbi:CDP-diacylglycerol--glycerol-3-phosphate 3-phosphatidyltransferase 2 isoform X1 [Amborella trichopoda]|uniref:CDP-diacylglycerol--glycerol-3-phosphate 3-phosphatidyltransferase 2 isoform X1 n=1 Tax=Amborella trichopoda TaxID=13333 RepID=UPI0009BD003A|nr:CDP-diacylglycerol--glycerol-3-phosphate 3-phosphatidyltransferase 2 isoform X1 [Amborella trichopoda]|eukprot:XP_020530653.1 CDP-diacylglycerol--glycerol-3-phosphate 3-phosphatidyltransferase 2 isoform X1 [Amborella trichopoda]
MVVKIGIVSAICGHKGMWALGGLRPYERACGGLMAPALRTPRQNRAAIAKASPLQALRRSVATNNSARASATTVKTPPAMALTTPLKDTGKLIPPPPSCCASFSCSSSSCPSHKLLTLPTVLTLGRVAAVPLLVTRTNLQVIFSLVKVGAGCRCTWVYKCCKVPLGHCEVSTFYMNSWWSATASTSIFVVAAVTDWLDGYLARKMKSGTVFGAFLDPVADKLMVAATLVLLCTKPVDSMFGQVPWLLTVPSIAIIGREITMSAVREWAASQGASVLEAVAVNNLGKWKTASQMIALTVLLATRDMSQTGPSILATCGIVLLYMSAGLAIWSLVVYTRGIWRILLK